MNARIFVATLILASAAQFGGEHTPDALQGYSLGMKPDPNGQFTVRGNMAAHEWHTSSATPDRKDGPDREPVEIDPATGKPKLMWPILAYFKGAWYPSIVWYHSGGFRASNGYKWGTPERWAYVRWGKEVWNEKMQRMEVPGTGYEMPAPAADDKPGVHMDDITGQQLVDILKRSFTVNKINKFMEASLYDEPDKGAPLE